MTFRAMVINEASYDPYYRLVFSYENNAKGIEWGAAELLRQSPAISIEYLCEVGRALNASQRYNLEMELLRTVMEYITANMAVRSYSI